MKQFFKYNLFVCLLLFSFESSSQTTTQNSSSKKPTIEEIVKWFVEKINSNSTIYSVCGGDKIAVNSGNYALSYSDDYKQIIVKYREGWNTNVGISFSDIIEIIPVQSISKIEYIKEKICINFPNSRDNEYIKIFTYGKDIILENSKYNYVIIPIDISQENNLLIRMQKALADLKSYFPKKQDTY